MTSLDDTIGTYAYGEFAAEMSRRESRRLSRFSYTLEARWDFFSELEEIQNVQQLLDQVRALLVGRRIDSVYLRGQALYSWGLRPTIGRPLKFVNRETTSYDADREGYLLNRFRRYSWGIVGRELGEKELLLLARHQWNTGPTSRLVIKSPRRTLFCVCR